MTGRMCFKVPILCFTTRENVIHDIRNPLSCLNLPFDATAAFLGSERAGLQP